MKTNTDCDCLVYSERKAVQFYFSSNAILKLHISSMLLVTSAIQSDKLHLYLRAEDVYINVSHLPYMHSNPYLSKLSWLTDRFYTRTGELTTLGSYIHQANGNGLW